MQRSFHHVARITFIGAIFSGAGRFIYLAIIGRFLGASILGWISVILSVAVTVGGFVQLTVGDAVTKFVAESCGNDRYDVASTQFSGILSSLLVSVILISLGTLLAKYYSMLVGFSSLIPDDVIVGLIITGFFCIYAIIRAGLYGYGLSIEYCVLEVLFNILLIGSISMIVLFSPTLFVLPLFLLYFGFVLGGILLLYRKGLIGIEKSSMLSVFKKDSEIGTFIGITTIIGLTGLVNGSAPLIMSFLFDANLIGYYSAANSFMVFVSFMPLVLNRATLPTISFKYGTGDFDQAKDFIEKGFKTVTESQLIFPLSLVLLSPLALYIIYGLEFMIALPILQVLSFNILISGIASYLYNVLAGTGNVRLGAYASVSATFITLTCWILFLPMLGPMGAALGLLFGSIVRLLMMGYWSYKQIPFDIQTRTIGLFILSSLVVVGGIISNAIITPNDYFILYFAEILLVVLLIKPTLAAFKSL